MSKSIRTKNNLSDQNQKVANGAIQTIGIYLRKLCVRGKILTLTNDSGNFNQKNKYI